MPSNKPPRKVLAQTPRTREQLLSDMKRSEKFKKKMDFTKNKFFPALVNASSSIDDAKTFLSSINNVLMEKFLGLMREKNFKDLGLVKALDPKDKNYKNYAELITLFDDMNVFDAKDCIEGMRSELDLFISDEMKTRPLSSLKPKWIDEIK